MVNSAPPFDESPVDGQGQPEAGWHVRSFEWLLAPDRFDDDAELEYLHRWRLTQALRTQRFAGWLATAMYVSALAADAMVSRRIDSAWMFWGFGILSVAMAVLLSMPSYWPRLASRAYAVAFGTLLVNGVTLIGITAWTHVQGDAFPQEWTFVLLIYTFVMTGMPYRMCVPLGIGLGLLSVAVAMALQMPPGDLVDHLLLDVSVVIMGIAACSALERSDRLNWLRAQQMQTQSYSDELTGLRNRRYLFEEGARRIQQAGREDLPVALLMIDVDYFKRFNDSLGHPAGDQCLRRVAGAMMSSARRPLDISARVGGEEFAVLLFGCSHLAAMSFAHTLREDLERLAIAHPASPYGHVTVSVGVAATDACGQVKLDVLILAADQALYRAKQSGRNAVCGSPDAA